MAPQINSLPKEILIEIFKQIDDSVTLYKISRVCHLWKLLLKQHDEIWERHLPLFVKPIGKPSDDVKIITQFNTKKKFVIDPPEIRTIKVSPKLGVHIQKKMGSYKQTSTYPN